MAKCNKEDILNRVKSFIGESDEGLSLLEDISDTIEPANTSELENKISTLEAEKLELEKTWRERYISRFGETSEAPTGDDIEVIDDDDEVISMSDDEIINHFK